MTTDKNSKLVRVFRKVGNSIADYTKLTKQSRKSYVLLPNSTDRLKAVNDKLDKLEKPVKPAESKARRDKIVKEFMAEMKKQQKMAEAIKDTKPDITGNLYYIKNGNYYLMYKDGMAWIMGTFNPYWCWLKHFASSFKEDYQDLSKDEFEQLLKEKYTESDLRLNYFLYIPTDWDFKTDEERKAYMKLNELVDYQKAIKV